MKPNFALNLSHDGIVLLHRGPNGWYTMGEVALDDPDMGGALDRLRALATAISPTGLTTKLVIPNSQILYRAIPDPVVPNGATKDADRIRAIRTSLDGATPYALDELVWDWRLVQGTLQIAVVARDTLAEAEAFATEYRFNPISFVAIPETSAFQGEPFFGRATSADELIGATVDIEPDLDAIVIRSAPPPTAPKPDTPAQQADPTPDASPTVPDAESDAAKTEPTPPEDAAPEPEAKEASEPKPAEAPVSEDPAPEAVTDDKSATDITDDAAPKSESETATGDDTADSEAEQPTADVAAPKPTDEAKASDSDDTAPPLSAFRTHRPASTEDSGDKDNTQDRIREQASRLFAPLSKSSKTDADQTAPHEGTAKGLRPEQEQTHVAVTDPTLPKLDLTEPLQAKPKPAPKVDRSGPLPEPKPMPVPSRGVTKVSAAPPVPNGPTPTLSVASDKLRSQQEAQTSASTETSKTATAKPAVPNGAVPPVAPSKTPSSTVTSVPNGALATDEPSIADISDVVQIDTVEERETQTGPSRTAGLASGVTRGARAAAASAATGAGAAFAALRSRRKSARDARKDKALEKARLKDEKNAPPLTAAPTETIAPTPVEATESEITVTPPAAAPLLPVQGATTDEEALTVFGARRRDNAKRGKPRFMGLILTLLLLALLGVVYIWASFLPDETGEVQTGALEEATSQTQPQIDTPTTIVAEETLDSSAASTSTDQDVDLADEIESDIADAAVPELAQSALPESLAVDAPRLSLKEVQDHYATTGVWVAAPQEGTAKDTDQIDDLYIASIDPRIQSQDAVALPDVRAHTAEDLPRPMLPPVPLGTTFDLDERGLVRATPEGALSPEGVLVFAGRPSVVTAPRPTRAATPPAVVDENSPAQLALKAFVPQPRPEKLIENNERANLGGITRAQLAAFRPEPRPASPQQEAQENAEALGAPAPAATAPRVATSLVPRARPANFEKLAAAARAAEAAAALAAEKNTTTNSSATRVTAKVPATTVPRNAPITVANAATVKNQINLRKLNLMGVYGSSSDRRALLRLPSGRFAKVKVGDKVSGGQIKSIGSDTLTYVKNGRTTTLKVGG
ncbi:hypothetical protein [Celeribacter sp.]|uniref:hypothetical protein n=1 Tax=Celeribacter sp. TaxID=1890673 RepID=UPI003A8F320A